MSTISSYREDWFFGNVPANWKIVPLKYLCTRSAIYGANIPASEYVNDGVRFLRTTDINDDGTLTEEGVKVPEELVEEYMLDSGDLLISRSGTLGRSYMHKEDSGACSYAGYLVRFVLDKINNPEYVFYLTKTLNFETWLNYSTIESTIGNVNGEKYANMLVPAPPVAVQNKIVRYINREVEEIDTLIQAKENLQVLLAEKKQALITRAVTKGVNPNARMKDSGIDWLGEIPEHWKVKKVKYIVDKIDEKVDEAEFVIAVENIESFTGKLINIDAEKSYQGPYTAYKQGDILFNKLRPYLAKVHLAVTDGALSGELLVLRPSDSSVNEEFLFNRMISADFIREVDRSTEGAKMPRASWEDFIKHIKIGIPPESEQIKISEYIKANSIRIDELTEATQKSIDLLKERRAALIAAAVTGEINVN